MARLRCPRCATFVEPAAGTAPTCPSCGFSAPAPARALAAAPAPAAAPASPPPLAAATPAAAARRKGTGKVVAIAAVAVLVLAGAAAAALLLRGGSTSALSEEEAHARLADALLAVPGALSGEPASDELRKVTMAMESDAPPSGAGDVFGGVGKMDLTVLYGRGGAVRFDLAVQSGAVSVAFTAICTPSQQFLAFGGETYGSREAVAGDGQPCAGIDEMLGGPGLGDEGDEGEGALGGLAGSTPFPILEDLDAQGADVTRHGDGSLTARFTEDGMEMVAEVDPQGRLAAVRGESDEGTYSMELDYGARSAIALPEDYELLPATVEAEESREGIRTTWTVTSSPQEPALGELEVRVQEWGFGSAGEALATFPLQAGEQRAGNLTFRFTDADGDGRLSAGDSYWLEDPANGAAGQPAADSPDGEAGDGMDWDWDWSFPETEAVLYDLEADGAVNSAPQGAPAPPAAWLALALGGLALAMRRRGR